MLISNTFNNAGKTALRSIRHMVSLLDVVPVRYHLLFLFLASLILKVFLVLLVPFVRDNAISVSDFFRYQQVAANILAGKGAILTTLSPTESAVYSAYKLQSTLIAGLMLFIKQHIAQWYLAVSYILSSLAVPMLYLLLSVLTRSPSMSLIGSVLYMIDPLIIFNTSIVSGQEFYHLFLFAAFYAVLREQPPTAWHSVLAGCIWGLAYVARPYTLVITPCILIFLWYTYSFRSMVRFLAGLLICVTCFSMLIATPPSYRHYEIHGSAKLRFALSWNFYCRYMSRTEMLALRDHWQNMSSTPRFIRDYTGYWFSRPVLYARTLTDNAAALYKLTPDIFIGKLDNVRLIRISLGLFSLLLYILSFAGIIRSYRSHIPYRSLWLSIIVISSLFYTVVMSGQLRYRFQWEPFIIIFAVYGLSTVMLPADKIKKRKGHM